jgi:hypothetical protein
MERANEIAGQILTHQETLKNGWEEINSKTSLSELKQAPEAMASEMILPALRAHWHDVVQRIFKDFPEESEHLRDVYYKHRLWQVI